MTLQDSVFLALGGLQKELGLDPSPVARIAYKWAKRASSDKLDLMVRLSMLEGAAGVTPGSWSDNPSQGLNKAVDHFAGSSLDPTWLSKQSQGVYNHLLRSAQSILRSSRVEGVTDLSAEEVLTSALMGMGRSEGTKKRVFYEAGKGMAHGILTGAESPMQATRGKANTYLRNSVLTEIKTYRRREDVYRLDTDDEMSVGDRGIRDEHLWEKSKGQFFSDVMFDPNDHLGQSIQRWVRNFLGRQKGDKYLLTWFDKSLAAREPISQVDVAKEFGIAPTGLGRYFKPALKALQDAFWRTDFAKQLEDRFFEEGGRVATDRRAARLAVRWMVQSFFQSRAS